MKRAKEKRAWMPKCQFYTEKGRHKHSPANIRSVQLYDMNPLDWLREKWVICSVHLNASKPTISNQRQHKFRDFLEQKKSSSSHDLIFRLQLRSEANPRSTAMYEHFEDTILKGLWRSSPEWGATVNESTRNKVRGHDRGGGQGKDNIKHGEYVWWAAWCLIRKLNRGWLNIRRQPTQIFWHNTNISLHLRSLWPNVTSQPPHLSLNSLHLRMGSLNSFASVTNSLTVR